ncbi:MAG: ribose 5-phosphate isomerase B [Candidatus Margulisiibacteriota bacterium]
MKIAIGSDHGGFKLKEYLRQFLAKAGHKVKDFGCFSEESVDYPDIARPLSQAVAKKQYKFGILVCGTGIGVNMVANKMPGIRAALCHNIFTAQMAREHNNANVLCLGGRVLSNPLARQIVQKFLATDFAGGRHLRRVKKIGR